MTLTSTDAPTAQRLSTLDRYLPIWIGLAMLAGRWVPGIAEALDAASIYRLRERRDRARVYEVVLRGGFASVVG